MGGQKGFPWSKIFLKSVKGVAIRVPGTFGMGGGPLVGLSASQNGLYYERIQGAIKGTFQSPEAQSERKTAQNIQPIATHRRRCEPSRRA